MNISKQALDIIDNKEYQLWLQHLIVSDILDKRLKIHRITPLSSLSQTPTDSVSVFRSCARSQSRS